MANDYNRYSREKDVNVIPEEDFKLLVSDTFETITETLRATYGPYGSSVMISDQNETTNTKDGYNTFNAMGFSHQYKKMVYLAIAKIIERVNRNVGDGTTSCILLAEKIFNNINPIISTPDEKRKVLHILDEFEKYMQNPDYLEEDKNGKITPLSAEAFKSIISLASNYDDNLTNVLISSFAPVFNADTDELVSMRNIVVESEIETDNASIITYEPRFMPGDYRVRVNMDVDIARAMNHLMKIKIVIFDHAFGPNDWRLLVENHDKETEVLVLARSFTATFLDNEYKRYLRERISVKANIPIILSEIKGSFVQNEIKDLAAVIGTTPITLNCNEPVNFDALPDVTCEVFAGNALCIHDVEPPENYIEDLKFEMKKDLTKSVIKRRDYLDRIRALEMKNDDTLLVVKAGTSLESKLIGDKIDDCVSVMNSAVQYGVVPNMLRYAYYRTTKWDVTEELETRIRDAISLSITGLFDDIWTSKHYSNNEETRENIKEEFYTEKYESFNIIDETFHKVSDYCTSAQYDVEVVVAAISIVKYLITSRAFIFDSFLMKSHTGDTPFFPGRE